MSILVQLSRIVILLVLLGPFFPLHAATLIPMGASWRFHRGDTDPSPNDSTAWRRGTFNDASWEQGPAPFAYGEPAFQGTDLTGMQNSFSTLFLRRTLNLANPAAVSALQLRTVVDDGFVVWINGVRVAETNAPASDAALTLASLASVATEPFESMFDLPNPSGYLVAGQNTIAVLVLNGSLGSSDLVFDAELTSPDLISEPPIVTGVSPTPGFVNSLTSITVTFSEPVTGVQAEDFLVNGVPSSVVTGGGATYTFSFAQPGFGPVDISWGTLHTIADLDQPPQRFDSGHPASSWAYQLINPHGPSVTSIVPVPGTTLRRLTDVEVTFSVPVRGIEPSSLQLNGVAALSFTGVGAGPYRFLFSQAPGGEARLNWSSNRAIQSDDEMAVGFGGGSWAYTVDPTQPVPSVIINEILAENQTGLADEEGDPEDWIELFNQGPQAVNLGGWSLSVDREEEGQWVFPSTILPAGGYLLVWASGKDRREPGPNQQLHTNFKLNPNGDTLRLFGSDLPRTLIDELEYGPQSPNHSFGRQSEGAGETWRFFSAATPAAANGSSSITGKVDEVHFSVERGFFNAPFSLTLACQTGGASIRYTLDGSPPTLTNGLAYLGPILIGTNRVVRAVAFGVNQLPSQVRTHTYLLNLGNNRRLLPVLSIVTATNNLYGRTGIMEYNPRNTSKHGAAWERPASVEWIRPEDNGGFQLDSGLRVAGGDYIRGRYNYRTTTPPEGKYSFRLYFRGDYGPGRLNYPVFPNSTLDSYNTLHLRAGMNDPQNPFLKDQFIRELSLDVGITACHGTFVYLFLNGVYKGLYNPCERVDDDFLQAYHGGGDLWDVIGPNNQAIRGDGTLWGQLRTAARKDLTIQANYLDVAARMDLPNFIDYLLPLIWADDDDWPHNNTRAAREKVPGAPFRFYPWDAEFAFTSHPVSYDTIATTLSSLSPPWGTADYQAMFNSLKKSPEFKLLFADRVHRAFFNDGPLTDERIRARYNALKAQISPSISGFNDLVGTWINGRRRYVTNAFLKAGFLASSNAPVASQFGGRVPKGYSLSLTHLTGDIFYTTDGADPRVAFTGDRSSSARTYAGPLTIAAPLHLKARSLAGTNWSALVDLAFEVTEAGSPIRISEIMYNPTGGDPFEYIELLNTGSLPAELSGYSFTGINFRFPSPFPLLSPGARLVLANDARPADFARRFPTVTVAGWFGGSLDNGGERIALVDQAGRTVVSVDYQDDDPWPRAADGRGPALEIINALGDPDDPANWLASSGAGSPGEPNSVPATPAVRINELFVGTTRDWVELFNPGSAPMPLAGWSLTDNSDARHFVFPAGTSLPPGGYLKIECNLEPVGTTLTAPFQLDRNGEKVSLFDTQTNRVDTVTYGPVADPLTIGQIQGRWVLCDPTPLGSNEAATLGSFGGLKINEFLANPDTGDDWLELHNSGAQPVALLGCAIVTSNATARIETPSFVAPGGFVVFRADEQSGPNHLDLKLPAAGGLISLVSPTGDALDRVDYGPQSEGIATGRLPDATGPFQPLPFSPTPGRSNYLAHLGSQVRISELLADATAGPDWVELENVTASSVSLTGFSLEVNAPGEPAIRWPLRSDAAIGAGERMVLYFGTELSGTVLAPNSQTFSVPLDREGAVLTLHDALGRVVDQVVYGPQLPNTSVGSTAQGFGLLLTPTPGRLNSLAHSLDSGDRLRLNEWLAAGGGTNDFVELFNPAVLPVNLSGWVLTDDPSISGSTNNRMGQLTFIGAGSFLKIKTDGQSRGAADHALFQLDRFGETIRLLNPGGTIVDTIDFGVQQDAVSEGRYPDGAVQIVRFPQTMSPGASNVLPTGDADGDGMDDSWEVLHRLDPTNPADASLDADGDGMSNFREFLSGTDPTDRSNVLHLEFSEQAGGTPGLQFIAQAGRTYVVEYCDSLATLQWLLLANVPANRDARKVVVTDPTPISLRPTRLYRIVLR